MREPKEVAKQIKKELLKNNIDNSVTTRGMQIRVKVSPFRFWEAKWITTEIYHLESHHWLIVWVNQCCLPMPPLSETFNGKKDGE